MLIICRIQNHYLKVGEFFQGLSDEQKLIYDDLKGPSWSPEKKSKKKITKNQVFEKNKKSDIEQSFCETSNKRLCQSNHVNKSL